MRKFALIACILAIPLTGCKTVSLATAAHTVATQPNLANTTIDEKTLYLGEQAYNTASKTYLNAVNRGLLQEPLKGVIKLDVQKAYTALGAMRKAKAALDATGFAAKYKDLLSAKSDVCTLITGKDCP